MTSGSLTAPDSTVRTVQQAAVLENISGYAWLATETSNLHDAQSHQDTQCNLDSQFDLQSSEEEDGKCSTNEVSNN